MGTAVIDRCAKLHCEGIFVSWSCSSYVVAVAAMHHSPMMLLTVQCSTMTNLAWKLPCRQLQCQQGCSLSPRWKGIAGCLVQNPSFFYVDYNPQPTHNIRRCVCITHYQARERQHNNLREKVKRGKMKVWGKIISFSFKWFAIQMLGFYLDTWWAFVGEIALSVWFSPT
jgi:hypothetical protein